MPLGVRHIQHVLPTYLLTYTQERLTAKQGGAAEFLDGGKMFNASDAVKDLMKIADATSDPIESFFGTHDNEASVLSKNTSFHVTGTIAAWNHNRTSTFLRVLSTSQRDRLLKEAVRLGPHLKRETDLAISEAAEHKLKRLEKQAKATRKSEKKLIKDLLNLRDEKVFKTTEEFNEFTVSVGNDNKKVIKEIKKQIRLLQKVHSIDVHTHVYKCTNIHITT